MAGRIVEFRGATSSLGTKNRSRHWRSLAGRSRGVRHTRIIREPIKSAQRARGRFAREPLQQVLGLRVVGEAVDRYRHRVADKLIARLHEGVAPRLLAVLIWGHDVIDERIVQPLGNFMAQGVDVLDGHAEDVGIVPVGEQESLQHHIVAVRTRHERVMVAEYTATVDRVAAI
jgi:hypothetical protein